MASRTSARLSTRSGIHAQLAKYAEQIVNDRQSLEILEVFTRQFENLFTRLEEVLRKEADLAATLLLGGQGVQWVVLRDEHTRITREVEEKIVDFLSFLKQVLRLAEADRHVLVKDQKLIVKLLDPARVEAFKQIAEAGIASEEAYVHALRVLTRVLERVKRLVKRLDKVKNILNKAVEDGRIREEDVRFVEETRLQAQRVRDELGSIGDFLPGLREVDAKSAARLAELASQL